MKAELIPWATADPLVPDGGDTLSPSVRHACTPPPPTTLPKLSGELPHRNQAWLADLPS